MLVSTRVRGRQAEAAVATFLLRQGLRILEQNVERAGAEVDLVALDVRLPEPEYVFVEVRSRRHDDRGSPLETVGGDKQRQIVRAATAWLVEQELWEQVPVRFDVVGVTFEDRFMNMRWIVDAHDG